MHKKIPIEQLRLGMHVHQLCGSWLDHPFWKSSFVLRDTADLERLRKSGVRECVIDLAKGLDVAAVVSAEPPARTPPATAPMAEHAARAAPTPVAAPRVALDEEIRRAAAICGQAREAVVSLFHQARLGRAIDTAGCVELVDEVSSSVARNPGAIVSLARLKTHDDYSYMHSVAVCALMVSLAQRLGMDEAAQREAGLAGLLHDMGKATMPLEILNKPGKLTDAEFAVIKSHPERGHEMLQGGSAVNAIALDVCLHHHEKTDGTGYPHGLSGDAISLHARMGAVCDVYDAITSNRPYKAGWDPAESIARMAGWAKGHFDEAVFSAFVASLGIYPTGSLVRLQSGLLGVVLEQSPGALVSPQVKVFFSTRSNMPVTTRVIDLSRPGCSDRIVGRESNDAWKFAHLDVLWAGPELAARGGRKG